MTHELRRLVSRPDLLAAALAAGATLAAFGCASSGATAPPSPPAPSPPASVEATAPAPAPAPAPAADATPAAMASDAGGLTVWDGVYTTRQARRGRQSFAAQCGGCHEAREFAGRFSTAFDLFTTRFIMPEPAPDSLSREEYADIIAYIYSEAGMPPGETDLPTDDEALKQVRVVPRPDGD